MNSPFYSPTRKRRSSGGGFLLIEAMICLSILTVLGIVLLKLSMNILAPRQWVMHQALTDAFMSSERAYAERVPFAALTGPVLPAPAKNWPDFALGGVDTRDQNIGALPGPAVGGSIVTGKISRTRFADPNNLPLNGGVGTAITNPASMNIWRVQSVLRYNVGGVPYVKARTVIRSQ
jgi:hypothetical protein